MRVAIWMTFLAIMSISGCKPQSQPGAIVANQEGDTLMQPASNASGFDKVYNTCFAENVDWTKMPVQVVRPRAYMPSAFDQTLGTPFINSVYVVSNTIDVLYRTLVTTNSEEDFNTRTRLEMLINRIKNYSARLPQDPLTDFRKSCMVSCVSANLIKYNGDKLTTKFGSTDIAVREGQGVCTEFARIGNLLAEAVGIPTRVVSNFSMQHAYNAMYIPSQERWYYVEPQVGRDNPQCVFMDPALQ
jgi:hypothetical protein